MSYSYIRKTTPKQRLFVYTFASILALIAFIGLVKLWNTLISDFYPDEPRPGPESDEFEWQFD